MDPTCGCWLWTGATFKTGYGFIVKREDQSKTLAHRWAWELLRGPIPAGMFLCHKCDVRNCVNPDHLFVGTQQDNVNDMWKKGRAKSPDRKEKCKNGHPLDGDNLYSYRGHRSCLTCRTAAAKRFTLKKNGGRVFIPHDERTHCKHGHEYIGENVRINCRGHRICVACGRAQYQKLMDKKRKLPINEDIRTKILG